MSRFDVFLKQHHDDNPLQDEDNLNAKNRTPVVVSTVSLMLSFFIFTVSHPCFIDNPEYSPERFLACQACTCPPLAHLPQGHDPHPPLRLLKGSSSNAGPIAGGRGCYSSSHHYRCCDLLSTTKFASVVRQIHRLLTHSGHIWMKSYGHCRMEGRLGSSSPSIPVYTGPAE